MVLRAYISRNWNRFGVGRQYEPSLSRPPRQYSEGLYHLELSGTGSGSYALKLRAVAKSGATQETALTGITRVGLKSSYLVEYFPTLGTLLRLSDTSLQDTSNGYIFNFNSMNGDYQFTRCSDGFTLNGTAEVIKRGCVIFLQDSSLRDRRIRVQVDNCSNIGTAAVQVLSLGRTFTILDRSTNNNTGTCQ